MAERAHPEHKGFQEGSPYRQAMIERYEWCNQFIKGKRVLDIPCGCGWGTSFLKGYKSCMGVDKDEEAIDYAIRHFTERYPQRCFMTRNMAAPPLGNIQRWESMDVVICLEGFEHVAMEIGLNFLVWVQQILSPGGLLLMTVPVRDKLGEHSGNPHHVNEMYEQDLIHMLVEKFRILNIEYREMTDGPVYYCVLQRR